MNRSLLTLVFCWPATAVCSFMSLNKSPTIHQGPLSANNDEETPYFWEKVSDFYLNNGLKFDNVGFALFFSVQL